MFFRNHCQCKQLVNLNSMRVLFKYLKAGIEKKLLVKLPTQRLHNTTRTIQIPFMKESESLLNNLPTFANSTYFLAKVEVKK